MGLVMAETQAFQIGEQLILQRDAFPELMAELKAAGYRLVGPTVRDGCIVFDEVSGVEDLPIGVTDDQDTKDN